MLIIFPMFCKFPFAANAMEMAVIYLLQKENYGGIPALHQNYLQILCAFALLQYLFQLNLPLAVKVFWLAPCCSNRFIISYVINFCRC